MRPANLSLSRTFLDSRQNFVATLTSFTSGTPDGFMSSAVGRVRGIEAIMVLHRLADHLQSPHDLAMFMQAPACVLFEVEVERYQVVPRRPEHTCGVRLTH